MGGSPAEGMRGGAPRRGVGGRLAVVLLALLALLPPPLAAAAAAGNWNEIHGQTLQGAQPRAGGGGGRTGAVIARAPTAPPAPPRRGCGAAVGELGLPWRRKQRPLLLALRRGRLAGRQHRLRGRGVQEPHPRGEGVQWWEKGALPRRRRPPRPRSGAALPALLLAALRLRAAARQPGGGVDAGAIKTLAGSGSRGYQDGGPAVARFSWPYGVSVAPDGEVVYVADSGNDCIRLARPATRGAHPAALLAARAAPRPCGRELSLSAQPWMGRVKTSRRWMCAPGGSPPWPAARSAASPTAPLGRRASRGLMGAHATSGAAALPPPVCRPHAHTAAP